jgi:hypothetical protein
MTGSNKSTLMHVGQHSRYRKSWNIYMPSSVLLTQTTTTCGTIMIGIETNGTFTTNRLIE